MTRIGLVGAGFMGRSALSVMLNARPEATALVIDRSTDALEMSRDIDPARVTTRVSEIDDSLALDGCDVVVNLAGPFFTGSDSVARAALRAGIPYVDVADDVEATTAVLALDELARDAGVPLVTGAGNSPGISNWMAARLVEQDPAVDGIQVVWVVHEPDPGGLAPLRHMLHMAVVPCPLWVDGQFTSSAGFVPSTAATYALPEPVGTREAFDTAHPEPLTLPRRFPHLRYAGCKGALSPEWANGAFSTLGRIGFGYHDSTVVYEGIDIEPAEFLWRLMWQRYDARARPGGEAITMIHVIGMRGSQPIRALNLWDAAPMHRGTGIGAAAAGLLLLEGQGAPGAHGVEILPWQDGLRLVEELSMADGGRVLSPVDLDLVSA